MPDKPIPVLGDTLDALEIVQALEGYRSEAEHNRKSGQNPRDEVWVRNLDLYWNRFDFTRKAKWQAKEVLPEVPSFVDRFAAALKEALNASPKGFYTVEDDTDTERDITSAIKHMTDVWLARCGKNQLGQAVDFSAVFEEQMKLGALMACAAVVRWTDDVPGGRVSMETVDPRSVWLDHTYRGLYRIRRSEMDRHDVVALADQKDSQGQPLFDLPEIERLTAHIVAEDQIRREQLTGGSQEVTTPRTPITLDEYIATVLAADGSVLAKDALCVVANQQFLIRGPEKNPFWHGQDWLLYAPLITTPLSVYGRSYMEDFGSVAKTFNELTNMLLDAVFTSSLKVFALQPSMLINPEQAAEGVSPNKTFLLEEGVAPRDFWAALDMGTLPAESFKIWQAMKNELREAAGISEVGSGQFAPKARTSATEILETSASSSAIIRSVATTIETRFLNPGLDLVWKTGLQHVKRDNPAMRAAVGSDLWNALYSRRKELISRPVTFAARGISSLLNRSRKLRALMNALQIIGSNELLLKEFLQIVSLRRLVEVILELLDIDIRSLQMTEREQMVRGMVENLEGRRQQAEAATPGREAPGGTRGELGGVAQLMQALGGGGVQGGQG